MLLAFSQKSKRWDLQAFVSDPSVATGALVLCRDLKDKTTTLYELDSDVSASFLALGVEGDAVPAYNLNPIN
jgi:hypothetical protein